MMAPLKSDCSEKERLLRMKMFVSVEKMRTPRTVPTMVPRPPVSSVPPITTAAIASSSQSVPWVDDPVVVFATSISAAMPQQRPIST